MKKNLAFFLLVFAIQMQAQTWSWAKCNTGDTTFHHTNISEVSADTLGNVFVSGEYTSHHIVFGTYTLTNPSYASAINDGFIVKFDANGNVLWAKTRGGGIDSWY